MKKKIYILALTFLCLLCSQMSFGQPLQEVIVYNDYHDSGDCTDPSSSAYPCSETWDCSDPNSSMYPCEYVDTGDCTDYRSYAYPCIIDDPCNSSSNSYDPCLCDPTICQGSSDPPSDVPPESCGVIVCSGLAIDRPYLVVNPNTCQCEKIPRPWYFDGDTDGWHDADEPVKTQIDSPGGGWIKTTKGEDCDDKNLLVTSNCYIDYFIDNDGDGYHSGTIRAKTQGPYKTTTLGPDCDDSPNGANVHKINKCGKCEVEPVSGSCDLLCNTFAERIKDILAHEGGYVNNPNDPGKETNKGITIAVWKKNAQSLLNIEPTSANLMALTNTQAAVLYKALYWDKIKAEDIVDGDIRYLLFDFFVNAGGNAVKVIQKTLNQLGNNLSIDGVIGDTTINAINNTNAVQLYNNFKTDRQQYYNNLANRSTKMATFLNGWTSRVNKFKNKTTTNNINVNCN